MIGALEGIGREALERLSQQFRAGMPGLLAACVVMIAAFLIGRLARWLAARWVCRMALEQRLRRSGFTAVVDPRGTRQISRFVVQGVYWTVLAAGLVLAINVVDSRIVERIAGILPRFGMGVVVILGGIWASYYLGRSVLIWAVNEDLPSARKLALAVRTLVVFAAAAIAADTLNFAGGLLRIVFVLILGGVVLAASLAVGLGSRDLVRRYFDERMSKREAEERSVWNHL